MNKKIFIPVIIAAVILPIIAFVGFTGLSSDTYNDDKITTFTSGTSGNFTSSELAEMAEIIILGDVQSVNIVEEKRPPNSRYPSVYSYVEIKPTEILKGIPVLNTNGNVLLRALGGETDNYRTETDDLVFSENDYVFLYLSMNRDETSTYIPTSTSTMFVIRQGEAKDNLDNLTDLTVLVQKHKDIIKGLP